MTLPLCNPPGDKQKRPERGCRAGAFSWRRRSTPPSFPFKVSAHVPRCGGDLIHYINESFDGGCDALAHAGAEFDEERRHFGVVGNAIGSRFMISAPPEITVNSPRPT
ncbi:hypothetical protein [Methylocystis sp.]|uniref:hypothetical protein n=1 Tax=Methylocystis sp. TaxID=1911079 RepID=UPI0025FD7F6A|nr:hypothetical protein [Methylocystis sp.]